MLGNTTSGICPTPGKDPDFLFASFCSAAVEEQQQEEESWCSDFRAAIGHPVSNHIPGKIEEAGVFGLTHLTEHSTLNTPTMETESYGFDLSDATPTTLDNEELFQNVWGFGSGACSPAPAEMVAVPPFLVDGGANMEDEGFCPSPDSAPLLSQLVEPTPPEILPIVTDLSTHVEPKVEDPSTDDLLSWIANDNFMPTSEMPGEVKEEEVEVQIPTTLDTSQLFIHYPTPQQDFDRPVAQPAENIVAERQSRQSTTKRRGRGRPSVPLGRAITPRLPRRRITSGEESDTTAVYYSTDEGSLTEAEAEKMRYRRMRDLNNEASKRCRENRKGKFAQLEEQRDTLMVRNQALRKRLSTLEANVRKLKSFYLEHLAAGRELPRPELMWSMLQMNPNEF